MTPVLLDTQGLICGSCCAPPPLPPSPTLPKFPPGDSRGLVSAHELQLRLSCCWQRLRTSQKSHSMQQSCAGVRGSETAVKRGDIFSAVQSQLEDTGPLRAPSS
ncbi:hypothetical protein AMEX_G5223 [Astyanax mexicanus]|uniref:Uncharacterized protein n=1 Tax=Astyanax mexicanus TaxID=7994 RepID=A0A8T2M6F9_ASTMX|nr:hypothetical protein AMEX_G5223 [Astyanax mexicanus]